MLAVSILPTPGCRNEVIDCHKAKICSVVLPIMDVKTCWNSTLELFEKAYRLWEFTQEWLQNPKYSENRPIFTTQDEWTMLRYVMDVVGPCRYRTLWIWKRHSVTLHHVITVYHDTLNHRYGVIRALAKMKTPWNENLYCTVKWTWQKLSKSYTEATPTTAMLVISAHFLDLFRTLRSFRKWDNGMYINPEDETSYTTQYPEASLKDMKDEYHAKHRCVPVIKSDIVPSNNLFPSTTATGSGQSSIDPYD